MLNYEIYKVNVSVDNIFDSDNYGKYAVKNGDWTFSIDADPNAYSIIDFGDDKDNIDGFALGTKLNSGGSTPVGGILSVYASNDNVSYYDIYSIKLLDIDMKEDGTVKDFLDRRLFVFKDKYRYYKFKFNKSWHVMDISFIKFSDKINVSRRESSLTYQLPMNTTNNILAKKNDTREGLLGMANDPENYGDLYVVGRDGKSHLTKAGMKSEVIFEGKANTIGQFLLSSSIEKYKYIAIENGALEVNRKVSLFSPEQLKSNDSTSSDSKGRRCEISNFHYNEEGKATGVIWINVMEGYKLNIIEIRSTVEPYISKVIGIY